MTTATATRLFDNIIECSSLTQERGKSNEWFTPARYIKAAEAVMGGIDLDPASCAMANQTVRAKRYYTKEDDGLAQAWYGNVWLNPPYGLTIPLEGQKRFKGGGASPEKRSLQTMFVDKSLREYKAGNVSQIMLLVTANTTVRWFQPLWEYPMCTPFTKIGFLVPGVSAKQRQVFGNVFVYLGPNETKFIEVFSQFGTIAKRVSPPVAKPVNLRLWEEV